MSYLKYYAEERERHADMEAISVSAAEARVAIEKLVRHFIGRSATMPLVEFTSGRRSSFGGRHAITLNVDYLTLRLVAHEFAHCWDQRRRDAKEREMMVLPLEDRARKVLRLRRAKWHGKRHARLVDRTVAFMKKCGWPAPIRERLVERAALAEERQRRAAMPPSVDERIGRRQEQVRRLERKIKSLSTRLRNARRSLSALQRSKAKREAQT